MLPSLTTCCLPLLLPALLLQATAQTTASEPTRPAAADAPKLKLPPIELSRAAKKFAEDAAELAAAGDFVKLFELNYVAIKQRMQRQAGGQDKLHEELQRQSELYANNQIKIRKILVEQPFSQTQSKDGKFMLWVFQVQLELLSKNPRNKLQDISSTTNSVFVVVAEATAAGWQFSLCQERDARRLQSYFGALQQALQFPVN